MLVRRFVSLILAPVFSLLCVSALRADDTKPPATLAHIKLSGSLDEAPPAADPLFGGASENFKSKLDRIKKAKADPAVRGLYLQIDGVGLGWGKLDEMRKAIADFRAAGKKVYAYLESGEGKDYLLGAACDEICLPESGWLMLTGMRAEVSFYKDLFDLVGIKADMLQMGDFKGAAEPYTRSSMSPAFRKQFESVLDDYYENSLVAAIAKSRKGMTPAQVKKLIDGGPYTAKAAKAAGLIDCVSYAEQFQDGTKKTLKVEHLKVAKNYGQAKTEEIDVSNPFALFRLLAPAKITSSKQPKVAVIYATGMIVTGKSGMSMLGGESCGSTTMIEAIRQAEQDNTVKAIVLRVDSPGGSALASDLMWNELSRCKKPVFASMSDTAASGGYYISMACRKIYAEPGTLTGSIGVVGGKIALGGAFDKVGLKTETISRGAHANILSTDRPFSDSERTAMTALMRDVYDQFLDKAIMGRKKAGKSMTKDELLQLAGGRVWTGRQAKANGLVDELGTLGEVIAAAWEAAGQSKSVEPELLILPKSKSFIDSLLDMKGADTALPFNLKSLGLPEVTGRLAGVDALLRLRSEPVWAIMPCRFDVR